MSPVVRRRVGTKYEPHPDAPETLSIRVDIEEVTVPVDADPAEARAVIDAWAAAINARADRAQEVRRQTAALAAQRLRAGRAFAGGRSKSETVRKKDAELNLNRISALFERAYRPGMGRTVLQSAAFDVLRADESRQREKLQAAQAVGNNDTARRISAELQNIEAQKRRLTVHRAGAWIKRRGKDNG